MLIDTHCHLDFKNFDPDRKAVIERAKAAGVVRIINVAASIEGTQRSIELARKYDIVYASVGIHPHEAGTVTDKVIDDIKKLASENKVVAIGEIGLDYYRNRATKEAQAEAFRKFIRLSLDTGLPLILHSREAEEDLLNILNDVRSTICDVRVRGVIHCFSGNTEFLKRCLDLGLYVSFTCNLTFKNAKALRETAKVCPIERILLETDAPFLAPQAFRGKRNEPSYLVWLVEEWSRITGLTKVDIARITTHNANALFGLGMEEPSQIAYQIRESLYLNITNRCTNSCGFCIRTQSPYVKGHNLKLAKEPSSMELIRAIGDPTRYDEIVFCGYGEPTTRIDVIKEIAKKVKEAGGRVRLVTNGHADLIYSSPIAPQLKGLVDKVSVSLDVDTEEKYDRICVPQFGKGTYQAVLNFIKACVNNNIETEVTCLDIPEVDIKRCAEIAASLGAQFRLRRYGVAG